MTQIPLTRYDHEKGCFVLNDLNPKPPANAFEWRRYTEEARIRRGEKSPDHDRGHKRSAASTKALEKKRETEPQFGTLDISSKTAAMIAIKPRAFTIYSKAKAKK